MNLHERLIALAEVCEQAVVEIGGMADRKRTSQVAIDFAEFADLSNYPPGLVLYGALRVAVAAADRLVVELENDMSFPEPLKSEGTDGN
mgnify:CR=1 FL=1